MKLKLELGGKVCVVMKTLKFDLNLDLDSE